MAIDFYSLNDTLLKRKLFEIKDDEWFLFDDIILQLKNNTGTFIDQYGTTRIYKNQIDYIAKMLKIKLDSKDFEFHNKKARYMEIYQNLCDSNSGLIIVGD